MAIRVIFSDDFVSDLERLDRKFPSVEFQVSQVVNALKDDQRPGDRIPNVGYEASRTRQASSLQSMLCRGDTGVARETVFNIHLLTVCIK